MSGFVVQESTHADPLSLYASRREAVAAIENMIRKGVASPGEFNIREIDGTGRTVRVFDAHEPTSDVA